MKKPKYTVEMLAYVVLILGLVFIIIGGLCFFGIMKPSERSMVQDPIVMGRIFNYIGVGFGLIQSMLQIIAYKKNKRDTAIIASGNAVAGTVEEVYHQRSTKLGRTSPYRICYAYAYGGERKHAKSHLIWERPDCMAGDSIDVYVDEAGHSALNA